jgi:hypothetical protein
MNQWQPIKININRSTMFRLFFVDDCLLFAKVTSSQARTVKYVVQSFRLAWRMRINVYKSEFLASMNLSRNKVAHLEGITEFCQTATIGKYLGFPFLFDRVKSSDFSFILYRNTTSLAYWNRKMLSRSDQVQCLMPILHNAKSLGAWRNLR